MLGFVVFYGVSCVKKLSLENHQRLAEAQMQHKDDEQ